MAGREKHLEAAALGQRLTTARIAAGYPSISALARELDLRQTPDATRRWLSEVESGKTRLLDPVALLALKRVIPKLDLDELIAGPEARDASPFEAEFRVIAGRLDDDGWRAVLNVAMFQAEESRRRAAAPIAGLPADELAVLEEYRRQKRSLAEREGISAADRTLIDVEAGEVERISQHDQRSRRRQAEAEQRTGDESAG